VEIWSVSLYLIECIAHAEMYPTLSAFLLYFQSSKLLVLDCNLVHHSQNPLALDSPSSFMDTQQSVVTTLHTSFIDTNLIHNFLYKLRKIKFLYTCFERHPLIFRTSF